MNDSMSESLQHLVSAINSMSPAIYALFVRFAYFLGLSLWAAISAYEYQEPDRRTPVLAWIATIPCYFIACAFPVIDPRIESFKAFLFCCCLAATLALPWRLAVFLAPKVEQIWFVRVGLYVFLLILYLATGR